MLRETSAIEQIQQIVARLLATQPTGHDLWLIGGFRYRLLDQGARVSRDVDYHWSGDFARKQQEILALFTRRLLPEVRRRMELDGDVRAGGGPDIESPAVRTVELAFWRPGVANSRIELPVEITRIVLFDPPAARAVSGVIYRTPSNADMIESKVVALFNRHTLEHRDLCDLFLFDDHFVPEAPDRLRRKLQVLGIAPQRVRERLESLQRDRSYHVKALGEVVSQQLDAPASEGIAAAGGPAVVLDAALVRLGKLQLLMPEGA